MRFLRAPAPPASRVAVDGVGSNGLVGVVPHVARPGAPQSVAAVAGDAEATVSWLAPSKDGGAPLTRFTVTSVPGGRTCARAVAAAGVASCTVAGLTNGVNYQLEVRPSREPRGRGCGLCRLEPRRPLGVATLVVEVSAHVLRFGQRVVYRATVRPALPGGTVLFAENGRAAARCTTSRVVDGSASCATRLATATGAPRCPPRPLHGERGARRHPVRPSGVRGGRCRPRCRRPRRHERSRAVQR